LKIECLLNILKLQIESRTNRSQTSCCHYVPPETFLGTEHHLADDVNIINKPPSSIRQRKATYFDNFKKKIRTMCVKNEEKKTNDDDDVVIPEINANA
jgi:hypothetical protein